MPSVAPRLSRRVKPRNALHAYLGFVVLPQFGVETKKPDFVTSPLGNKGGIYLYRERRSGTLLVCKFFGDRRHLSLADRRSLLNLEFSNLNTARRVGFRSPPQQVVRPLAKSERLNSVLVEDFIHGHDLDYYISKATYDGQHHRLFGKLTKMAHFLAELHNRTVGKERVDFAVASTYFKKIVSVLIRDCVADAGTAELLRHLCSDWEQADEMWAERAVIVHGDATPTNFIFDHEQGVTAIDLERMHEDDRVYDIGMLAGELRHHFALRLGRADAAEPFIGHFLWAYSEKFPDSEATFRAITHRNRFYMALSELRIARNHWLPREHREWLVREACRCLR